MMPIRSMTGYARVRREAGPLDFTVSVKSVNHRGLDLHFHISAELDPVENEMRNLVKKYVQRGHLDIRVSFASIGTDGLFEVDSSRLGAFVDAYRQAASKYGLTGEPDLNAAFRLPGVLREAVALELGDDAKTAVLEAFETALQNLNSFREREGGEIAELIRARTESLLRAAAELDEIRKTAIGAYHERLREKLAELIRSAAMDPQRLAQEAAILAERSDIGEEIDRLRIHARQMGELVNSGGETGKKLDFLLQEMNRETNTILSKTTGLGGQALRITDLALAAKADIEKVRELALNIE
ncbi:MAG TPA: YicC/YloC family endoribonuclease [Bryobacteraceae bacterium]|nr:YicC/YloC family endoribonuclease [Bryobacteraceae bacterium]